MADTYSNEIPSFLVLLDPPRQQSSETLLFGLDNLAKVLGNIEDHREESAWLAQVVVSVFTRMLLERRLDHPPTEDAIRALLSEPPDIRTMGY